MSKAKHTPGPWHVSDADSVNPRIDVSNGRGVAHATQRDQHPVIGQGISIQEAMANARLIAAAPDLLEALETYAAVYAENWRPGMPILEPISDAAIAKARGES